LSRIFVELGEEPHAQRFARAIEEQRKVAPFETTGQLGALISRVGPRRPGQRIHPATRVFQALRLAVNDELGSLRRGMESCWTLLRTGGRMAIITFHSLEARIVKEFGRRLGRDYAVVGDVDLPDFRVAVAPRLRWVQRRAIQPSRMEVESNPRARSAQLRVFEKI
jgi:16S rRNA (cytosine1402-N4)-methyltransferase